MHDNLKFSYMFIPISTYPLFSVLQVYFFSKKEMKCMRLAIYLRCNTNNACTRCCRLLAWELRQRARLHRVITYSAKNAS